MFKRTFWFTTGATAGFGGAMWIRRQVLRTVRRYTPEQVQAEVTTSVRRFGSDLREAVSEARRTMADREAQLRDELRPGGGPVRPGEPPAAAPPVAATIVDSPPPTAPTTRWYSGRAKAVAKAKAVANAGAPATADTDPAAPASAADSAVPAADSIGSIDPAGSPVGATPASDTDARRRGRRRARSRRRGQSIGEGARHH